MRDTPPLLMPLERHFIDLLRCRLLRFDAFAITVYAADAITPCLMSFSLRRRRFMLRH